MIDPHDIATLAAERVDIMRRCGLTDAEIIFELATNNITHVLALKDACDLIVELRRDAVTAQMKIELLRDLEGGL
jgi:selenocysteine lyase/cysteine desulfurase